MAIVCGFRVTTWFRGSRLNPGIASAYRELVKRGEMFFADGTVRVQPQEIPLSLKESRSPPEVFRPDGALTK